MRGKEAERNVREAGGRHGGRPRELLAARFAAPVWVALLLLLPLGLAARSGAPPTHPQSTAQAAGRFDAHNRPDAIGPMEAAGATVRRWRYGDADAYWLVGDCSITFAGSRVRSDQLLVLVRRSGAVRQVQTIAEGGVTVGGRAADGPWTAQLQLNDEPVIRAPRYLGPPRESPALLATLQARFAAPHADAAMVQQAQYAAPAPQAMPPGGMPLGGDAGGAVTPAPTDLAPEREAPLGDFRFLVGGGSQAVQILARSASSPPQISSHNRPEVNETVYVGRGGLTVLVQDVQAQLDGGQIIDLGTISLSADRVVAWAPMTTRLFEGSSTLADAEGELYLEGDIVFRQGDRVIYADRMYYNVVRQYGMILSAEAVTPVPEYQGLVRLKADVIQQVARGEFIAFDAAVTTSRMGVPRYWLQSEQLQMSSRDEVSISPLTGTPVTTNRKQVSSRDNFVYVGGFPVLYWPVFSTDLERSSFYVTGVKVQSDSVFGTQAFVDWDMFQLLGLQDVPEGIEWTLSTDYLSQRGPALGTAATYALPGLLGLPGPVTGYVDAWAIDDDGLDNLGGDRRDLVPEEDLRGRLLARHRHYLPNDFEFIAEVGLLSDRNFLEQYLENEWDRDKDHDTGLRLRKYHLNQMFDLAAEVRTNEFYTDTNRLPQLDHYLLGSSVLADRLTWSMHNHVGYADLEVANAPTNPVEAGKFTLLPGEVEAEGLVAATRQEVSAPLEAGPVKVVPFLSGEAAYWGEDVSGQPLTRLLGQAGVRSALPMWRLYPTVQSSLLNIRGLAHKVELRSELFYADSDTNLDQIPLYDPLDDDAQEQARRRFVFDTFGGGLPQPFDPRNYAFRQGLQRYVTSPSTPIADDLLQTRLGLNQRWQTKRGLPGRERIVDLARLNVEVLAFPEADRDNFGETLGPTRYDFRYHAGDRVTLLSDGYFDFFDDALRSVSAGVLTSRPGLGDLYVGMLSLEGPISSTVLRSSVDYRLNEKWIFTGATTFDLGEIGNVGQTVALTRIGESALLRLGVNVDEGRDNVSFVFMIEPRFLPGGRLGFLGGELVPPPGVEGLE